MALLLLAVAAIRFTPYAADRAPAAVTLLAMRGTSGAQGPARRPLLLRPDLNGLPAVPEYRLRIVDRAGEPVWEGTLGAQRAEVLVPAQPRGVYFVRVSLPSGELLREYALELRGEN